MDITLNAKKLTLKMFLSIEESLSTTLEMKNIKKTGNKNTSQHNTPNTQYTSTEKRSSD